MSMDRMDDPAKRVLAALRETEPPAGIEQRVVDAVRLCARSQANRPARHVRTFVLAGAAATCVAIAGVVLFSPHATAPQSSATVSSSQIRPVPTKPASPIQPLILRRTAKLHSPPARTKHDSSNAEAPRDVIRVVSRPAPPAPLTQQEKLLLELAATRDANRTELLNPEIQQERQMEAKAEFDRFFNVRPTGETE